MVPPRARGIGTSTPRAAQEIVGDLRITDPENGGSHGRVWFAAGQENGGLNIDASTGGTWADISFLTNGAERMRLTSYGQLGINVTEPDIPSDAMLAVSGKIYCEEVEVMLASEWPDFVFDSDYALPSLESVETSIAEEGHLPGVPSAGEISAKGLALGEMQATLLRKIEEMTLYMIDLNRQVRELRAENVALRARPATGEAAPAEMQALLAADSPREARP